jgi:hypothetical protein
MRIDPPQQDIKDIIPEEELAGQKDWRRYAALAFVLGGTYYFFFHVLFGFG